MSSLGLPHNVVQKLLELTLGGIRETLEIQVTRRAQWVILIQIQKTLILTEMWTSRLRDAF